ncbi:ABC transporter ATP-binding protein [Cryobacterium arcticum]|uniref:ABC transporter ATP-binding protein n=1 Tax=Cryobacterium arcticum TaxID=670052 RepID=A0A317ZW45_9MICO|nr:ABC transporter ATP-binding protein [Cryobacterium arcticum]PXA68397.1 ABC transporter ATP-binding protein [Cryobacterium arcticum]
MTVLARLDAVTRRFGEVLAVDDVTLDIHSGSILGLLGPNGAGKSTVLTMLQGLRRPSSGTVSLFGGSPGDYRTRQKLGCTPQETALPPTLRVGEVIDFVGRHFEHPLTTAAVADEFGLGEVLKRQTGALSGGQKRRLSVALAFVGQPRLVLLDEPTTGLDVDARRTLWDAVRRQHDRGATVVVTSHYLEEIEALAERVVVMAHGRVIADDTVSAVINQVSLRQVRLVTEHPDRVSGLPGVVARETGDDGATTFYATDSDRLIEELVRSGIPFAGLTVRGATLEEAFLTLTGATDAAASSTQIAQKEMHR